MRSIQLRITSSWLLFEKSKANTFGCSLCLYTRTLPCNAAQQYQLPGRSDCSLVKVVVKVELY